MASGRLAEPARREGTAKMDIGSSCLPWMRLLGKRILVVEDEAIVALAIEDDLLNEGARIMGPVGSVDEALRLIEEAAADGGLSAAVLDIHLSGVSVLPVADQLAELGVPFLFATGYSAGCSISRHTTAPVLHKPFSPRDLIAAVGHCQEFRVRPVG
jgi:CheY-like chemotaxis protein